MQFQRIICAIVLIAASSVFASAQSVHTIATGETTIGIDASGNEQPIALVRADNHAWQPAKVITQNGRYIFTLSPAELDGNNMLLLINPPADLDIHDVVPPYVTGLKIDGKPYPAHRSLHLGAMRKAPRVVLLGVADAANALDTASVEVSFNGNNVSKEAITIAPAGKNKATITVDLGDIDYGNHRAVISIHDASPQHNTLSASIAFDRLATTNYLSAAAYEVTFKTDSVYPGYESLVALNDGFVDLDGLHCGNDVSWASEEQPADHWVEVTMDQPRTISEVSLYWAHFGNAYHTSQKILVQIPDGDSWQTIYTSPSGSMQPAKCTTLEFQPVKTQSFRIFQPAGNGSPTRANLMWLAEIEAR